MKPVVFIGSSSEAIAAKLVSRFVADLKPALDCRLWTDDVFNAGDVTIDALRRTLTEIDLAVIFLTNDDVATIRSKQVSIPRDNAVMELGMALQVLGRDRAFFVFPLNEPDLQLPSDIDGVTGLGYTNLASMKQIATSVVGRERELRGPAFGSWRQLWEVDSSKFKSEPSLATVLHHKDAFRATWRAAGRTYVARATVLGRHITGTWYDGREPSLYSGAFQLVLEGTGERMTGIWCGFTDENAFKTGAWTWDRVKRRG